VSVTQQACRPVSGCASSKMVARPMVVRCLHRDALRGPTHGSWRRAGHPSR
jgi:hypothetical protein